MRFTKKSSKTKAAEDKLRRLNKVKNADQIEKKKTYDSNYQKEKMQNEELHEQKKNNDKYYQSNRLKDHATLEKKQEYDRSYQKEKMQNDCMRLKKEYNNKSLYLTKRSTPNKIYLNYFEEIKEGPTYTCTCCGRLWFKTSVSNLNKAKCKKNILDLVFYLKSSNLICRSCSPSVYNGSIPRMALSNGLDFALQPDCLKKLSNLEERLVAPRVPFMRIVEVGCDRQKYIHGNVVNVPIKIDKTLNILPRCFDESHIIQIEFMLKMEYKKPYLYETIRPKIVLEAIRYLITQPLYINENITME